MINSGLIIWASCPCNKLNYHRVSLSQALAMIPLCSTTSSTAVRDESFISKSLLLSARNLVHSSTSSLLMIIPGASESLGKFLSFNSLSITSWAELSLHPASLDTTAKLFDLHPCWVAKEDCHCLWDMRPTFRYGKDYPFYSIYSQSNLLCKFLLVVDVIQYKIS